MKVHVYKPDDIDPTEYVIDKQPTLDQLREWIGGGYIEITRGVYGGRRCEIIVDEEGLLKNLPVNKMGTGLRYHSTLGNLDVPIVGTIAIMVDFDLD